MRHLRDFLHPVWRDAFKSDKFSDKTELNKAVLDVFDEELQKVEDDTIHSKAQSFLSTASDEWLDYWGSWFGLKREDNQSDEDYRKALINHVKHARSTVPALKEAIAHFLKTNIKNVNIYEPYNDVFFLDDSNLDSDKYLISDDYYTYGVIDIQISVPFPPDVIDIINWFRPAGVLFVLTYRQGAGIDAPIWTLPPEDAQLKAKLMTFKYMTGLDKEYSYSLTPNTRFNNGVTGSPFFLDDSYLDSFAVLSGSKVIKADWFNAIGYANGLVQPSDDDTVGSISKSINNISKNKYYLVEKKDGYNYPFTITKDNINEHNMLKNSQDLTKWTFGYGAQYSPYKNDGESSADIAEFHTNEALISTKQKFNMVAGKEYTISLQAKTLYQAPLKDIAIYANIDRGHTALQVTDTLTDEWQTYSVTFTYRGNTQDSLSIYTIGDFDIASKVYVSNLQVEEGAKATPWSKSYLDIKAPIEDKYTYVYTMLDVRSYYYNQIESEGSFKSRVGFNASDSDINKGMSDYLEQVHLVADYSIGKRAKKKVHTQLMLFNFSLGMWVNFRDGNVFDHDTKTNFKINSLETYLNNQGLLVIAFRTETLDNDFTWYLNEVQLDMTKTYNNQNSINIYGDYIDSATELYIQSLFGTTARGQSNQETDDLSMYDKYQKYHPIRYIRNTIKRVHPYKEQDNVPKGFILDDSDLNGIDNLVDIDSPLVKPATKDPYSLYHVLPKYYTKNKDIPLVSVSILGASIKDSEHKNILGNLLPGGIYSSVLENMWRSNSSSSIISPTDFNGSRLGLKISNDSPKVTDTLFIDSQSAYKEQAYKYSMQVKSDTLASMRVRILLISNGYKYPVLDTTIGVTNEYQPHSFKFTTNKVFADTIRIELIPNTKTAYDYEIAETRLGLDTKVYVDNKLSTKNSPQIIPKQSIGTNLVIGTNQEYVMGFGIPNTSWTDGYAYLKLPTTIYNNGEILPQDPHTFWYTLTQGVTYTQTIWLETDATIKDLSAVQITWLIKWQHDYQPARVQKLGQNSYKIVSTYKWPDKGDNNVRLFDIQHLDSAFDFNTGTYLKFGKLKLEKGSVATDYVPYTASSGIEARLGSVTYDDITFDDFEGLIPKPTTSTTTTSTTSTSTTTTTSTTLKPLQEFLLNISLLNDSSVGLAGANSTTSTTSTTTLKPDETTTTTTPTFNYGYVDGIRKFNSGVIEAPLKYSDEEAKEITYKMLDNLPMDNLPNFRTIFDKTVVKQEDVDKLLNFLASYYYHLQSSGSDRVYDFENYLQEGTTWLSALGFQAEGLEHTVTVDLGNIHTDIAKLLVHHGSDSDLAVQYDSLVQTSVDGKHWTTWYDNYKGTRPYKDNYYIEPEAKPKEIPISPYNVLQQRNDKFKPVATTETINGTIQPIKYVSTSSERYPALSMSKLVLNESMNNVSDGLMLSTSEYQDTIQRYQGIRDENILSPYEIMKKATPIPNEAPDYPETANTISSFTDTLTTFDIADLDTTPVTNLAVSDVLSTVDTYTTTTTMWWTSSTSTTSRPTTSTSTTTKKANTYNAFILNESVLDGGDTLVGGTNTTTTTTSTTTIRKPDEPIREMHLVSLDLLRLIDIAFPTLWNNLGVSDDTKRLKIIKEYLTNDSINDILNVTFSAIAPHGYTVSIWDNKHNGWKDEQSTYSKTSTTLAVSEDSVDNYMTDLGQVYAMVSSTTTVKSKMIAIGSSVGYVTVTPKGLDTYNGGLYPHKNLAIGTSKPKTILGHGSTDELQLYTIADKAFNHKVVVSFNLYSTGNLGTFDLQANNFELDQEYKGIDIETGHQHYAFVVNLPYPFMSYPSFSLILHNYMATLTVSAFKIEYGVEESPWVDGNEIASIGGQTTTTTTQQEQPSEQDSWAITNSLDKLESKLLNIYKDLTPRITDDIQDSAVKTDMDNNLK